MNERIKELARQADACYIPRYDMWQMDTETLNNFAELIVRECCAKVERQYKYSKGTPVSFWEMSQDVQDLLKEHFGVEE